MLKTKKDSSAQFKENDEVNAKINAYIKANPKRWEYVQNMTPDRMARTIMLNDIQKMERSERIRESVLKKLDEKPELKQAYETLVRDLPETEKQKVIASLALRNQRTLARTQKQETQTRGQQTKGVSI
jgi:hypothetical protein